MHEYIEPLALWLVALTAAALVIVVGLAIVAFSAILSTYLPLLCHKGNASLGNTVPAPPTETKPAPPIKKELPGRSCGHCGMRIKNDPVRGLVVGDVSYNVYACPTCKKETLLPYRV